MTYSNYYSRFYNGCNKFDPAAMVFGIRTIRLSPESPICIIGFH